MSYPTAADFPNQYKTHDVGVEGLIVGDGETLSRIVADGASFGNPAWIDEGKDNLSFGTKGNATTPRLLGVFQRTQQHTNSDAGVGQPYAAKEVANIRSRGQIWVKVDRAVVSGQPAYLLGNVWTTVATGTSIKTPYIYRSSTSAAGLAKIEVFNAPASLAI